MSLFIHLLGHFTWHGHPHALATISPTACLQFIFPSPAFHFFLLPLLLQILLFFFLSHLFFLPPFLTSKSLWVPAVLQALPFSFQFLNVNLYSGMIRQMSSSLLHLLFKSFMLSVSLSSNSSATFCL